jgi:hypothetical protein
MKRPEPTDWRGYVAFILAMGLAVGWATALIMSASSRTPPIGQETGTLLATLGGGMAGAVGAYLGMGRRDPPPPPPEEHTQDKDRDDQDGG